jgi:hypothetical protein
MKPKYQIKLLSFAVYFAMIELGWVPDPRKERSLVTTNMLERAREKANADR